MCSSVLTTVCGDPGLSAQLPKAILTGPQANDPKEYGSSVTPVSHLSTYILQTVPHFKQDQTNNVYKPNPSLLQMVSSTALQAAASNKSFSCLPALACQHKVPSHWNYQ